MKRWLTLLFLAPVLGIAGAARSAPGGAPPAAALANPAALLNQQAPPVTSPLAPLAPPPARWLLQQAHRAAGHVPFSGRQVTLMWHRGETLETLTQEYYAGDGRLRIETLLPARARGRIVVYDGRERWQYEPARHAVYLSSSPALEAGPPVDELLKQYAAAVAPRPGRVAGRRTWRVDLTPRLAGKIARRMWIDAATGMVLRYERTSARGRTLSASHFSHIRLGEPPASLFQRPGPAGVRIVRSQPAPQPLALTEARRRFGVRLPAELPGGYRFADATLLRGKGHPVAHLRYRDGLSAVSLYVGPPGGLPYDVYRGRAVLLRQGTGRLQSVQHFYVLSWRGPRADFALVGDTSAELLARLANGTALTAGAGPAAPGPSAPRWLLAMALFLFGLSGAVMITRRQRRARAGRRQLHPSPGR
jgi:sigma-E factor negative regulatory protein RseB